MYPPYPQPSKGIIKILTNWNNNLPISSTDIEIYDINGIKINTGNTVTIENENAYKGYVVWDAQNYNPGIYILRISQGRETSVRKVAVTE